METTRALSKTDQIKALAHPLRQRILESMIDEPITTKQVADLLGEKPTKLYHHVDRLHEAGLIELIRTQPKRGTVEKYFQAVAQRFVIDRAALEVTGGEPSSDTELQMVISNALDATLEEIGKAIDSGLIRTDEDGGESLFLRSHVQASPAQMSRLLELLQDWVRECQGSHQPGSRLEYGMTVAFYPTRDGDQ